MGLNEKTIELVFKLRDLLAKQEQEEALEEKKAREWRKDNHGKPT